MVAQITAVVIFLVMFSLIITEKFPKQFTTLVCGALTLILVFGVGMNIDNQISGSHYNWVTSLRETLNVENIFKLGFWYTAAGEIESKGIDWATIFFLTGMKLQNNIIHHVIDYVMTWFYLRYRACEIKC